MFSKTIKVCFGYPQSEYLNKIKVLLHFPVVSVGDAGVWWKLSWNITKMESRDQCDWEMDWIYLNFISINWTLINFRLVSKTIFTYTCLLTYYASFPARVNPSTPRTRPTLWLPAQATAPTSLQVGDFVYFYSLVLQTIHRFHNQFLQSWRRPLLDLLLVERRETWNWDTGAIIIRDRL